MKSIGLASSPQGWLAAGAAAAGPVEPSGHAGLPTGTCNYDPGMMRGPGPTRMTAARTKAVRKPTVSTWWQDGLEPRKIDISDRQNIYSAPQAEGQACAPQPAVEEAAASRWTLLQLLLPECCVRPAPDRPRAGVGNAAWLPGPGPLAELFSNTGRRASGAGRGPGKGHTARVGCGVRQQSSLALGLVGARAFPPVRLPLFVEAADADPLAPPH